MQEHLKKRLKDRQAGGHANNKLNSPPASPHKVVNSSNATIQNGNGKGQPGAGALKQKQIGKTKGAAEPEVAGRLGKGKKKTQNRTKPCQTNCKFIAEQFLEKKWIGSCLGLLRVRKSLT